MASRDTDLARVIRALKDLGCAVQIEVVPSGKRPRLRATLPHSNELLLSHRRGDNRKVHKIISTHL